MSPSQKNFPANLFCLPGPMGMMPMPMMGGMGGMNMTDKNGKPLQPNQIMQKYQAMMKKMQKGMKAGNFQNPFAQAQAAKQNFRGRLNTFHQKFTWRAPAQPTVEQTGVEGEAPKQRYTFTCTFQVDGETLTSTGTDKNKKIAARKACQFMVKQVKKLGEKECPPDVKAAMEAARERKNKRPLSEIASAPSLTNALMLLTRLAQSKEANKVDFDTKRAGETPNWTYTVTCKATVNGSEHSVSAQASKKKEAKRQAGLAMVQKLGSFVFQQADKDLSERPSKKAKTSSAAPATTGMGMDIF